MFANEPTVTQSHTSLLGSMAPEPASLTTAWDTRYRVPVRCQALR